MKFHVHSEQPANKMKEVKTGTDILTKNIKEGVSKDVAVFVAGVALQHLRICLGHVQIMYVVAADNTSHIWCQVWQHNKRSDVPHQKLPNILLLLFNVLSLLLF